MGLNGKKNIDHRWNGIYWKNLIKNLTNKNNNYQIIIIDNLSNSKISDIKNFLISYHEVSQKSNKEKKKFIFIKVILKIKNCFQLY